MNKKMIETVKYNLNLCTEPDEELSKSIIVQADKGLLIKNGVITNDLIDIGFDELYHMLHETINDVVKQLKKVNLTKPFKRNVFSRYYGIPLDADYLSPEVWLYERLTDMIHDLPLFDALFEKINEVQNKYNNMITSTDFKNSTVFNQTAILAELRSLREMKLSLVTMFNCYKFILKNPQVRDFYIKWLNHKQEILKRDDEDFNQQVAEHNQAIIDKISHL